MIAKLQLHMLGAVGALCLGLTACSGKGGASGETSGEAASEDKGGQAAALTLADGPDVCFRAIVRHLGENTRVSEIDSFFSAGSEIDSTDTKPRGTMTYCSVQYQNPDDPRKLLDIRLDIASGQFSSPRPVEITVAGNAAAFRLEDYLIPLSSVNAAALTAIMDAQKDKLGTVYGKHAWTGVRLETPGAFSNRHRLRLDVKGRLAANDIQESGYAIITTDGKTIESDYLMPR
ncbi:MAG: hypothetical protein LBV50_12710 [Novosphingobium sp.]|nr:hypothetical protein [Novosphingobium sp.]